MSRSAAIATAVLLGSFAAVTLAQPEQFPEPAPADAAALRFAPFSHWTGSIELGLNGATGNVERFSGRGGIRGERRTDLNQSLAEFTYIYARTDGDTSQNEAHLVLRNDRLFVDSPWRLFGLGFIDYDELKDWDFRTAGFLGVGYAFVEDDRTQVVGRVGAGLMREWGGGENAIVPEGLLGLDVEHQLTERQRIVGSIDFFPDLREIGPYRFLAKAAWEILVDPEVNMSLRVGAESRYDSSPGAGLKRHDLDYFAVLVWSF
jgi:hypothetical protein